MPNLIPTKSPIADMRQTIKGYRAHSYINIIKIEILNVCDRRLDNQ